MKRTDLPPTVRAVVYIRMSTSDQEDSPAVQLRSATKYAEEHGWTIICVYEDAALSRAEYVKRPGLYRMLSDAAEKKFDVVILRDIDRLGGETNRNQIIIADLIDAGVRVDEYHTRQTLDLSSPTAKLLVTIKSFAAETERLKTSVRTHESLAARAERGWVAGGAVYGYSLVPVVENGKRVRTEYAISQDEASFVRELWDRHWINGHGYRSLALDFNARRVPGPKAGKRGTLSANVRETTRRPKFSVEGEPASSRELSDKLSPCLTPPDGSDGEGQATEVHRRVQAEDPQGGRLMRSRGARCSPPS